MHEPSSIFYRIGSFIADCIFIIAPSFLAIAIGTPAVLGLLIAAAFGSSENILIFYLPATVVGLAALALGFWYDNPDQAKWRAALVGTGICMGWTFSITALFSLISSGLLSLV
jgi:hypothetical protein